MKNFANVLKKQKEEIAIGDALLRDFPDLLVDSDRWQHERLCSAAVNTKATDVLIKHSCGCCAEATLQAWPFLVAHDRKIYSNPPCFDIGEGGACGGDIPFAGWRKCLTDAQISDCVIAKVQEYFDTHAPHENAGELEEE
jgi:hypothetical protein